MTDPNVARDYVKAMYPGHGWKDKVKIMSDNQVLAIYLREQQKPKPKAKKPLGNNDPF